jgi:hypothetical protein
MPIQDIVANNQTGGAEMHMMVANYMQAELAMQTDILEELNLNSGISCNNPLGLHNDLIFYSISGGSISLNVDTLDSGISYQLTLPSTLPSNNKILKVNSSNELVWTELISSTGMTIDYSNDSITLTSTGGVSGDIDVDNIDINFTLSITGLSTFYGLVDIINNLSVTGNTTLQGTLDITGDTGIVGNVGVTGNTTMQGTLDITGDTGIIGNVGITGNLDICSGIIKLANGSPSNPSYTFCTDQDTGMYLSATNELSMSTAGTQRVVVDASGNVGIGSATPTQKLDVNGDALIQGGDLYLVDTNEAISSNGTDMFFTVAGAEQVRIDSSGNVGIGSASPTQKLDVNGDALIQGGDLYLVDTNEAISSNGTDMFFTVAGAEQVRIDSSGNVGIGTNAPAQHLHVYNAAATGSYNFTGGEGMVIEDGDANLQLKSNNVGSYGSGLLLTTAASTWGFASTTTALSNKLYIGHRTSASDEGIQGLMSKLVTIETSGNVGIGTDAPSSRLHVHNSGGAGQIQLTSSTSGTATSDGLIIEMSGSDDVLFLNKENTNMIFYTNNTEQVRIDSSGNVGIGTNAPTQNLDVRGNALFKGTQGFDLASETATIYLGDTNHYIQGEHSQGLLLQTANEITFNTSGANERMVITESGNVGIGSATPTQKLDVDGSLRLNDGNIYIDWGWGVFMDPANNWVEDGILDVDYVGKDRVKFFVPGSYGGNGSSNPTQRMNLTTTGLYIGATGSASQSLDVEGDALIQGGDLYLVDTNEAISSNGTDMYFTVAGTEQVRIDSSGNVGIGTNAPAQHLHVYNAAATGSYNFTGGEGMVIEDGDANLQLKSNNVGSYGSGLLLTTAASTWGFASTTTALSNKLYIGHRTSASDEGIQGLMSKLVTIETSGNVGIGTDAPSSRLHVHNSGGAGQIQLTSSTSGTATSDGLIIEMSGSDDVLFLNKENTNMIFYTNNTEQVRIDSSGNVGIGTNAPTQNLDVRGNALFEGTQGFDSASETATIYLGDTNHYIQGEHSQGLLLQTGNEITFNTGGANERMVITGGGDVGIGTNAPANKVTIRQDQADFTTLEIRNNNTTSNTAGSEILFGSYRDIETTTFEGSKIRAINVDSGSSLFQYQDLAFYTNNAFNSPASERMRITKDGDVGIGTDAPSSRLHVHNSGGAGQIQLTSSTSGTATSDGLIIEMSGSDDVLFLNKENTNMIFYTNNTEQVRIDSSGNVGIGTNAPVNKVTIRQDQADFTTLEIRNNNTTSNTAGSEILFGSYRDIETTTFEGSKIRAINVDSGSSLFQYQDLAFYTNNAYLSGASERMRITKDGDVGIGTNNPGSRLHLQQVDDTTPALRFTNISGGSGNHWQILFNSSFHLVFKFNNGSKGYLDDSADVSNIDFTGQHRSCSKEDELGVSSIGLIVSSTGEYMNFLPGVTWGTINESLPCVELAVTGQDKRVFGVISNKEDDKREYQQGVFISIFDQGIDQNRLIINSIGEGGVWVCNKDGTIENGDYITSCTVPGYGTKQSDDLLHNYTVAKITQDEDFSDMTLGITAGISSTIYYERARYLDALGNIITESEYDTLIGVTTSAYKAKFVGCSYHSG